MGNGRKKNHESLRSHQGLPYLDSQVGRPPKIQASYNAGVVVNEMNSSIGFEDLTDVPVTGERSNDVGLLEDTENDIS